MKKVSLLAVASLFVVTSVYAAVVRETFATDPALDGWQVFGDTNLIQWNSTNHVLDVTWDSTQTNSYFYYPLGRTYTTADGFYIRFDLQLADATNFNWGMELAVGLLHYADATNSGFSRADFISPNVCEFDYFPQFVDPGTGKVYADSVEASMIDDTGNDLFQVSDIMTPSMGVTYRVELIHQPGTKTIGCMVSNNGQVISTLPAVTTSGDFDDFQLDMLSITSYQDDGFGDSILAHGSVGNVAFASPLPVGLIQTPATGQVQFASDTNWVYTLQGSADLINWTAVAPGVFGNGTNLLLQATTPPVSPAFFRVRADLP